MMSLADGVGIAYDIVGHILEEVMKWLLPFDKIFWCTRTRTTDARWSLFSLKSRAFGLGQINSGAFGVFLAMLSAPILIQWVVCPCFPLFNNHFYKKLRLYIQIPSIYLELGFEYGPQRVRFWPSCVRSSYRTPNVCVCAKSLTILQFHISEDALDCIQAPALARVHAHQQSERC